MLMTKHQRISRDQVPNAATWDLTDLFASRDEWEEELRAVQQSLPEVTQYQGEVGENAATLRDCLEAREQLLQRVVRVATYANLRQSADSADSTNQADAAKVSDALAKIDAALSFVEIEIISVPEAKLNQFFDDEPKLIPFSKYVNDLKEKQPHTLSAETESALASLGSLFRSPYTTYNRSKLSDMQFEPFANDNGEYQPNSFSLYEANYEASPSAVVRKNAFDSFVKTLKQYKNTFAATYATKVNQEVVMSRLRNYDSVTDMLLAPQQVTQEMYHNQLDILLEELAPHMRRFAKLKQQVLGLEKMAFHDLKAPLDPDFNPETSYEEAAETVLEALKVMGPEYSRIMETALSERWIDYADNIGKSTGAFCSSPYGVHPYILTTWTNQMRGAFTLAHELGHAGHFYLAGKNQRMTNTRPSTYFIEAPSTMNEMLLGNHLLSNTDDTRMRRWVILQLLGTYYHNFVTHLLEGAFQRRVYQLAEAGEPLTADVLSGQKAAVLSEFWGAAVEIDEGASLTWMRQPHYYMGLYPYTYSAGLTVSTAVSQTIFEEGQPAIDRWLDVLKAGGTKKPLDLIKQAGVDMEKPDAIRQAVSYVASLIDELEKSYN
ncbi:oligoendopeptidase F [Sediminibacillus dalangtanensis]|uniref:Oligopeptidase F n=1 Tax=Sediminibacillus dalangtanensis TaxID=2729421 RepID=A0ABX7VVP3_9BACI|nr:oligoendopeptidase F [Sediminibacillus dalangtanensis]QTN00614.1 oligoendopeptidase F [Sediminibacillus dalangtanensis]